MNFKELHEPEPRLNTEEADEAIRRANARFEASKRCDLREWAKAKLRDMPRNVKRGQHATN